MNTPKEGERPIPGRNRNDSQSVSTAVLELFHRIDESKTDARAEVESFLAARRNHPSYKVLLTMCVMGLKVRELGSTAKK